MCLHRIAEISLKSADILLSNGAESYRVEETIQRICKSYGVTCDCISMANGIFLSVRSEEGTVISSLRKIRQRRVDLYRIELVNELSRRMEQQSINEEEALQCLEQIERAPHFSFRVRITAACMTAFVYTLFFNGTLADAVAAIMIGGVTYTILEKVSEVGFFQFFEFFLSGAFIGGASLIVEFLVSGTDKNNVITGSVMILLPGVALTNGIRDALYGDFTSGLARFGEAMMVIIAVGAGIGMSLTLLAKLHL